MRDAIRMNRHRDGSLQACKASKSKKCSEGDIKMIDAPVLLSTLF